MKTKKIIASVIITALTVGMFSGCDSKKNPYEKAGALFDSGQYMQAALAFGGLNDYKDSEERAKEAGSKIFPFVFKEDDISMNLLGYTVGVSDDGNTVIEVHYSDGTSFSFGDVDFIIEAGGEGCEILEYRTGFSIIGGIEDRKDWLALDLGPGANPDKLTINKSGTKELIISFYFEHVARLT
jgi:hypothetical protein